MRCIFSLHLPKKKDGTLKNSTLDTETEPILRDSTFAHGTSRTILKRLQHVVHKPKRHLLGRDMEALGITDLP